MYPYHNKIKHCIFNNELLSYTFVAKDKDISSCLLLHFDTEPKVRTFREHRFKESDDVFIHLAQR